MGVRKEMQVVFRPILLRHPLRPADLTAAADPVAHVAAHLDLPPEQIVARPPATFVFDRSAELPIRMQRRPPRHINVQQQNWWKREQVVHTDITRYQIYNVVEEIYAHVRLQHPNAPSKFICCTKGEPMLQTFEMLGSLHYCLVGTCFTQCKSKGYVLLDAAMHVKTMFVDTAVYSTRQGLMAKSTKLNVVYTGSTMVSIPFASSEHYRITSTSMRPDDDPLPPGLEGLKPWMRLPSETSVEIPEGLGVVKLAVEIDRSLLGLGNVIFFETADACNDADKVYQRLQDFDSGSCEGTKLLAAKAHYGSGPRFYILVPRSMNREELPHPWEYEIDN